MNLDALLGADRQRANKKPSRLNGGRALISIYPHPPAQDYKVTRIARVFWLPLLPTLRAFPESDSSGSVTDFVSGYSCGAATDSHRLPRNNPYSVFFNPENSKVRAYQNDFWTVKSFFTRLSGAPD